LTQSPPVAQHVITKS
jgi:hypothetical protein